MSEQSQPDSSQTGAGQPTTIVIQQTPAGGLRVWFVRFVFIALFLSVMFNFALMSSYEEYYSNVTPPLERFHSGDRTAKDKIAVVHVSGTIMPPFTDRIRKSIKRATEDKAVLGVLLVVDSPGGLVADSHQIYHDLNKLREKGKLIFVVMKRMAASGGYYVSMGAGKKGKIFAEPTTWTGSIGVIIPRYDASGLAEKLGVSSDPLKTGEFKDALSPFRKLTEREREVWETILDDSYQRFIGVIVDNRPGLNKAAVTKLATGQVYTAGQAKENGLIDEIGYEEDALDALKKELRLEKVRVVSYDFPVGLADLLLGSAEARQPEGQLSVLLEATVPRAMYYCSWAPVLPVRVP